jgi:ADP-ribose pyrophosphatase
VSEVVEERTVFRSPWLSVSERVVVDNGRRTAWHYLEHPGCALVLPITASGEVALIRAWRAPVARWCWEAPAGRIDAGEAPLDAARRELREEIGGVGGEWHELGSVYASSGSSNERIHVFTALNVQLGPSAPNPDEKLELALVPWPEAVDMAEKGEINDGASALAVLWTLVRGLGG